MIVALRELKRSTKISSISSTFCGIKTKCSQYLQQLTELLHNSKHSQFPNCCSFPILTLQIDSPLNGENLSRLRFSSKYDPRKKHPMEFGRNRFPPFRKIFWRKRKSPKNSNQISSEALQAEIVQQSLSDVDSGRMISSYRDVVANDSVPSSEGRNLRKIVSDIRQDVYTPYGKWLTDGWLDERAKSGTFVKVVSYNILAQSLLRAHPELYRRCNEDYLTWNHRSFVLIKELHRFNADILCLQEVEAEQLDFFNTQLGEFGYRGVFKKRTNEKDDGCAIYYKEDKFQLRECVSVEYYQPNINLLNRDNIGIVMRLSPKGNRNQCIVVATTHLLFNPKRHDIKLAQMQMLLAEIDRVAFKSTNDCNEPSYYPIILTGDFNLKPYTLVYNLLVNGTVDNISQCYQPPNLQFRSPNKPLIPVRLGITDGCQHYHVMKNRDSNRTEISDFQYVKLFNTDRRSLMNGDENFSWRQNSLTDPVKDIIKRLSSITEISWMGDSDLGFNQKQNGGFSCFRFNHYRTGTPIIRTLQSSGSYRSPFEYDRFGSGSLYHNLNLASVYSHDGDCARDASTFQDGWCTVDYIFYGPSKKIDDARTSRVDGDLKLVSFLRLPDCDQIKSIGHIPNEVCPSDHLPLSATFHLPIHIQSEKCSL